ncbi:MAG: cupredoxin domain-containing protein [Rickettsiaceae bacterium]|nr:cupredoxin domain-containing protein [Rickettsiaceae bacterium]
MKNNLYSLSKKLLQFSVISLIFAASIIPESASAEEDVVIIELSIKDHKFEPEEIKARQGKKIKIKVTNLDSTIEEFESHDLCREKIIQPGQTVNIILAPLRPGIYGFVGEFHQETAKGKLIVE